MRRPLPIPAAFLALTVAACGSSEPEPDPTPTPEPVVAGPRALIPAGLAELKLGPKIEGPQGTEVEDIPMFEGRELYRIESYVACPGADPDVSGEDNGAAPAATPIDDGVCDPATRPAGTIYTYVHQVTPLEGSDGPATAFRMTAPATGFDNTVGFDRAQAEAALGEGYTVDIEIENRRLVWRIEKSDGWNAGETMTFFWRSTLPPEGPGEGYCLDTAEGCADATGPLPPRREPEPEPEAETPPAT